MSTDPRPVVSVCIANYNGEHLLEECLRSVLAQENAPAFEIIVHDDASTDRSLALLEGRSDIRVLASESNTGFCVSNNRMAAVARGEHLLLLNNDATLAPGAMAALHRRSLELQHRSILGLPQYDDASGKLIDRGCWLDWMMNPVPRTAETDPSPAMVVGACLWVPVPVWNATGGFPEWFGTNAEDVYLCCAARWLGFGVDVLPMPGYRHKVGRSQGGGRVGTNGRLELSTRRRYLSERNRALLMCIFQPCWLLPATLLANAGILLLEAVVLMIALRRPALPWQVHITSQRDAWRLRGNAFALRRRLAAQRAVRLPEFFRPFRLVPAKLQLLLRHGLPIDAK